MSTIIGQSELLRRAVNFIVESLSTEPERSLSRLIDEASMRFNLSPLDTESLLRLLKEEQKEVTH